MAPLMTVIDEYGAEQKERLKTLFVFLTADRTGSEQRLPLVGRSLRMKSPMVISMDGAEGPGNYGLNKQCLLTIVVAKENAVTANFALTQPALKDGPKITEALAKQTGGKGLDLKEFEALVGGRRPDAPQVDPQLGPLMRAVIQRDASAEDVKKAADAVEKYVGNDRAKQKEVARIAGVIVQNKYGTEAAQKQAKVWVEKYGR